MTARKKLYKGSLILAAENKIEEIAQNRRCEQEKSKNTESEKANEKIENFKAKNPGQFSSNQKPKIPKSKTSVEY